MAQESNSKPADARLDSFLKQFCAKCHNASVAKAEFQVHDIDSGFGNGADLERWEKILEMVSIGDMPPENEKQPTAEARELFRSRVAIQLKSLGRGPDTKYELPSTGNRISHSKLFSGEHTGPAFTTSRLWRISPEIYQRFAAGVDMARKLNAPLQVAEEEGFRDYSLLYADEATIRTMLQNCKRAATTLLHGRIDHKRRKEKEPVKKQGGRTGTRHRVFDEFINTTGEINPGQMKAVLDYSINLLLQRNANQQDYLRYVKGFLEPNCKQAGPELALGGMLSAIMMSPEFLFRIELGLGDRLPDGRRMLSSREIAYAISFAIFDYVDTRTLKAAEQGKLNSKEDVAREFRRMLNEPDRAVRGPVGKHFWTVGKGVGIADPNLIEASHPRLLRFFREFFGYTKVREVFKDDSRHDGKHKPDDLIRDADWFVLKALKDDRQVLKQLLTSDRFFVQTRASRKPIREARSYNLDQRVDRENKTDGFSQVAIKMPEGQRAGMLTHPAWLAAHSGNFENDPVRRGKWIRERLLAGVVPDLPIGIDAMLPDQPHRTLKQRFDVVKDEQCWRCHKKMNPLGDPFEAYDDFGRFRTHHLVSEDGNIIATEFEAYSRLRKTRWRESHKKGTPAEQFSQTAVDSTGLLTGTGDPKLDGPVSGPTELAQRLAQSERVRQSFIRHVFRYWMGRNEALSDSPTLMAMDQAYVNSDGSFREMLVALITSDSFLYRK